jgi:hypothetical protein
MGLRRTEPRLSSTVARLCPRPGVVSGGLPSLPATSLVLRLETRLPVYQDTGTATPATANSDPVGNKPDRSASASDRTQSTAGLRPVLAAWSGGLGGKTASYDGLAGQYLGGTGVALTGAFTAYLVGSRAGATDEWCPCGTVAGIAATFLAHSDGNLYVANDAGTAVTAAFAKTGSLLLRIRRDAGNVVYAAWTGSAEASLGTLSGTLTLTSEGARVAASQLSKGTHRTTLLYSADLVTSSPSADAAARAYISANDGVTL